MATAKERQQQRRERLHEMARANGYDSWYKMVTDLVARYEDGEATTIQGRRKNNEL